MSRSGYNDGYDDNYTEWDMIKWRGQVISSIRGKRGQAFLKELIEALDSMPEKKLINHELIAEDGVCALGCIGVKRGVQLEGLDPNDYYQLAAVFGVAAPLVREIVWINDDAFIIRDTPERRWQRVREWAKGMIK